MLQVTLEAPGDTLCHKDLDEAPQLFSMHDSVAETNHMFNLRNTMLHAGIFSYITFKSCGTFPCLMSCETDLPTASTPRRHSQFYVETVVFQVEDVLFRLPRHPFESQSEVFRAMFTLTPGSEVKVEGTTDDKPIRLEVKLLDFERFARALCPVKIPLLQEGLVPLPRSIDEWTSILRLSTMWDFARIRDIAITSLQRLNMSPLAKILLAREFNIHDWEWEGYVDLISRPEMLSTEDALEIGYADSIKIFQIRESLRSPKPRLITGLTTEMVKPYFQASSLVVQAPQPVPIEEREPPSPVARSNSRKGKGRMSLFDEVPIKHDIPIPGWPGCRYHDDSSS